MKKNETLYDMYSDKTSNKYDDTKRNKHEIYDVNKLPKYIINNKNNFRDWLDWYERILEYESKC